MSRRLPWRGRVGADGHGAEYRVALLDEPAVAPMPFDKFRASTLIVGDSITDPPPILLGQLALPKTFA